jgi:hypothetical protein
MDRFNEMGDMIRIYLRSDSMAKIEYMALAITEAL